jgi:hypothetical protein
MRCLLRHSAGLFAALATLGLAATGLAGSNQARQNIVLELFTSQGDSSCPKADNLFSRLSERPNVLALTFPVHYWDYLGWRDTLASHANSERQRGYARARGDGQIYTPQVVVQGITHANGGDEAAIDAAIEAAKQAHSSARVSVNIRRENGALLVDIGGLPDSASHKSATVWLAIAKKVETVQVTRGENSGKKLVYTNPVRELAAIGLWKGEPMTLSLPLKDLKNKGGDRLFVLLQVENAGPILGAAAFERM